MVTLKLFLLGPPRVELEGRSIAIERHKALALLSYLAVTAEAQARDTLATLLWPDSSQSRARAYLSRDLSILNKALPGNWLEIDREQVGLPHAPGFRLDVEHFQQLATCPPGAADCLQALTEAATLYRDDFLTGFTLPNCPAFDEWQFFQTEGLRQSLVTVLERLVDLQRGQGDYEAAILSARRRLSLDPLHEPAHRQLMQLYAKTGQQGAALRQYQACVRLLAEELGVPPQAETTALFEQLKRGSVAGRPTLGGRYACQERDVDLLGQGHMGRVYRGVDVQTGRPVAVKVLKPEIVRDQPNLVERFAREGEALRQLNHPNIVNLLATDQQGDRHYLVLEYVPGGSLRELLQGQGALPLSQVLELALDLADALTRAHRLDIIHRDLKPENILLAEDGTPRLTDFGIARQEDQSVQLTRAGTILGTVYYLSPEACQGADLDPRTDIWAFGVLLFELLTGQLPFRGESPGAIISAILSQPAPDLASYRPEVPEALADLVGRMLEKDSQRRLPSMRLVGAALEALLQGRGEGAPPPDSPLATPVVEPLSASKHNLPAQTTPFVGREQELATLGRLLADPELRLVTILGAGGVGKTRLALEAAATFVSRTQADPFPHGLYFVSLAPLESAEGIVATVAKALNFSFYQRQAPEQQLLDYLRQKRLLLLLDNFEHLLEGAGLVVAMLEGAPGLKVLTTSRARLNIPGEQLFQIAGIDFPEADARSPQAAVRRQKGPGPDPSTQAVTRYSAVKLFLQSARRARADFELTADNVRAVVRICRLVEGFPLALIMAAAWVELLSPVEIAAEIDQSLDFLATDWRGMPERQRSMRAVCDHSWGLLSAPERHLFQALSVFRGGFTREAAQAVTAAPLPTLMRLVNKSFLHRAETGRYQVHELLRQYGAEKLAQAPEVEAAVRRQHGLYYAAFLQRREKALKGPDQQQALAEIEAESENIQVAWYWAIGQEKLEPLAQMVDGLGRFYDWRGRYQAGESAYRAAVAQWPPLPPAAGRCVAAKALAWRGFFSFRMGKAEEATELVRQSLTLLEDPALADQDTRPAQAFALKQMAEVIHATQPEAGKQLARQSLALYRACSDRWNMAEVLYFLSQIATGVADYGEAKHQLEECLALRRALGDQKGIADTLSALGLATAYQGVLEAAERLVQESIALGRDMDDRLGNAERLEILAIVFAHGGQFVKAHALFEACLATWQDLGIVRQIASEYMILGAMKMHLGRYAPGREQLALALNLAREADDQIGVIYALFFLSQIALVEEKYDQARQLAREIIPLARVSHHWDELAGSLNVLGWAAYKLGDRSAARRAFCEVQQLMAEKRLFRSLPAILVRRALYLAEGGEDARQAKERAVELYALALQDPYVANSRWFDDVAGRHIAAVAATMPPAVVAAAQARGRTRALAATAKELLAELEA